MASCYLLDSSQHCCIFGMLAGCVLFCEICCSDIHRSSNLQQYLTIPPFYVYMYSYFVAAACSYHYYLLPSLLLPITPPDSGWHVKRRGKNHYCVLMLWVIQLSDSFPCAGGRCFKSLSYQV